MARKPSEIVPTSLRIRESLRLRVEQAAAKRQVSFNYELTSRVQESFDRESQYEIGSLAEHLDNSVNRLGVWMHELNKQGDLIRAAKELIQRIELQDPKGIDAALTQIKNVLKMIEIEAARLPEKMGTT
jgi:hypothetical protein